MRYNENLNFFEDFHDIELMPAIGEALSTNKMKGLVLSKTVGVPEFQKLLLCPTAKKISKA
ncbi:MAG: hypothetical protein NTY80_00030 [candidate division SR1 bacterium]|nr:hypothetical protein [candidate division SR1 bacterium]